MLSRSQPEFWQKTEEEKIAVTQGTLTYRMYATISSSSLPWKSVSATSSPSSQSPFLVVQGAGEGILEFLTPKWADFENYDVIQFPVDNQDDEDDNYYDVKKGMPNIDMFVLIMM